MGKETIEEKVRGLVLKLRPELVDEDLEVQYYLFHHVVKLIELAIAEEREACAVVAEGEGHYMCTDAQDTARGIADLIRSRSEP